MTRKLPHVGLGSIPDDAEPMRSIVTGVTYGAPVTASIRFIEIIRGELGDNVTVTHLSPQTWTSSGVVEERGPIRVDATVGKAIREIEQDGEVI